MLMASASILIVSFLLSLFGTWGVVLYGQHLKMIDTPNHRSSHTKAVPKGGGIGILLAFVFLSNMLKIPGLLWGAPLCIGMISFIGDRNDLPVRFRLFVQIACAVCFLLGLNHGFDFYSLLATLFYVLFIVGTSNIFNFMDGVDGIAGLTAIVAFGSMLVYADLLNVENNYSLLCLGIIMSCLGFLIFNFPKAMVFMGDVGSVFLGFLYAGITVMFSSDVNSFICMICFLLLFYTDSISTIAVRAVKKESLVTPHRQHLYQLLTNELKVKHWKIALIYGVLQLFINLAILYFRENVFGIIMISTIFIIIFIIVSITVRQKVSSLNEDHSF